MGGVHCSVCMHLDGFKCRTQLRDCEIYFSYQCVPFVWNLKRVILNHVFLLLVHIMGVNGALLLKVFKEASRRINND